MTAAIEAVKVELESARHAVRGAGEVAGFTVVGEEGV